MSHVLNHKGEVIASYPMLEKPPEDVIKPDKDFLTVGQVIGGLNQKLFKGSECPCCQQNVQGYRRAYNATMAKWLIWLVKSYEREGDWLSIHEGETQWGGDFAKNHHWQLIVQKENNNSSKRTSGVWMPTEAGIEFVHKRMKIPSHIYLYNNEPKGFSGKLIDIEEALRQKFNYQELMNGIGY